ncbi:MAG TPA: cystathionine gamma-synthase [Anaerolineae bacterium]|nr:cystathionine gamma-synthase [Anaerolineae bacterium]MCB0223312.1 cystathionine gamma-synthase [Anaerolineae bacterium]MCB9103046.1 cystathionine gamma-synthase [Anaerolineales bacterium]HRV91747.1 cystathionine gamma-synthase [Anaerolineae bacterium]
MSEQYRIETLAIHAGQEPDPSTGAIMTPIYQTSTYVLPEVGQNRGYEYSRSDNPTRTALQANLAALEGAKYGLAFASGLAATDIVMRLMRPGDHIVVGDDVYGGTYRMFDKVLKHYGLNFSFVDLTDLDAFQQALRAETKLVWLETPTNPNLKLADIAALSELAHARQALVVVDNTFASSYLQNPLALGADLVLHSTTKYLGGHSDVVGGAVMLNDQAIYEQLKFLQNAIGSVPAPMDCWLVLRGIKTLAVRMERHCRNALTLAQWLADHPAVARVIYPGLPDHPQHELAKRQMKDFGGMISIILNGGEPAALELVKRTKLFALAESLGGVESLIEVPHAMTHASTADSDIAVDPGLVRLSVGIEHIDDLRADLAGALVGL